jgi:hypothetical protein
MLTYASLISLASGLTDRLIKPSISIILYQAFVLIFAVVAMVVIVIMFRKYKGFLQTKCVMNAGNAEFGSTILSRLQPEPYSWSRDSQHTFGRSYTSTFGRSYTGTLEGAILAHSEGTTGTLGRSYPPSDFKLSIKPGIPLSQNSSSA